MNTLTQHTIYGKATGVGFTVQIHEITSDQWADIEAEVNDQHGVLKVMEGRAPGLGFAVAILDERGNAERVETPSKEAIQDQLFTMALENGWTDTEEGVHAIDLAQFDPWDLGYCFQMAAYGEHIVG